MLEVDAKDVLRFAHQELTTCLKNSSLVNSNHVFVMELSMLHQVDCPFLIVVVLPC